MITLQKIENHTIMNTKAKFIIMGSMITLLSCGQNATKLSVKEYPETRKDNTVVD